MDAKTEVIALQYGRLVAEVKEPGCNFLSCFGRDLIKVSTAQISTNLPNVKVADYNGNPIIVSAVVQYEIVDAKKAVLDVQNFSEFVRLQASTVLRQVVAQYPYDSSHDHLSLRTNITTVNEQLATTLNGLVGIAGCRILSFRIDELAYSPEVAAIMLRKQAAQAIVSARKLIVESATGMACDAIKQMEAGGSFLNDEDRTNMVINMISVLCSNKDVVPTMSITRA